MVKGLGRTLDAERSGPETTVVTANSVKPNVVARPCPVLSHLGLLPAASREMGFFLKAGGAPGNSLVELQEGKPVICSISCEWRELQTPVASLSPGGCALQCCILVILGLGV